MNPQVEASRALEIAEMIGVLLWGQDPGVQGAVLAELLGRYLAGWVPQFRESVLKEHIDAVRKLTLATERQMFGEDGHPGKETVQ
jgi:hypothetical protein